MTRLFVPSLECPPKAENGYLLWWIATTLDSKHKLGGLVTICCLRLFDFFIQGWWNLLKTGCAQSTLGHILGSINLTRG